MFGGMKGIACTQVAQYFVLTVAYTVPAEFPTCKSCDK